MRLNSRSPLPLMLAASAGLLIGAADFISTDFRPAILMTAFAGAALGSLFPGRRWRLAICIGLFAPIAIVLGMASGHRPARGHFVLIDARAVLPALLGAGLSGQLHSNRRNEPINEEETQ
jgi:hypothetical protein